MKMKTNKPDVKNATLSKNCWTAKKAIVSLMTVAAMFVCCGMTVFAAGGEVDASSFISTAGTVLKSVIILIGAGIGVWGVVNLLEGYGNDNPGAKSQGMKQLMAGLGLILLAIILVPVLIKMMTDASVTTGAVYAAPVLYMFF